MQSHLRELLTRAIEKVVQGGRAEFARAPPLLLEAPKQREFGDLATNVAMLWAKSAKKPPRMIAETILRNIEDPDESILARAGDRRTGIFEFYFRAEVLF